MKSIVISIGGSVILSDEADLSYFNNFKDILKNFSKSYKIFLIVGGGKTARFYIKTGRNHNLNEDFLDEIGIDITKVNAKLLAYILGISNKRIPNTTDEAIAIDSHIVIMGGTTPGHSTDLVGAELAEKINAYKFLIATNVDGVFDKDPNKYSNAKQFKEIKVKQLLKKFGSDWNKAGKNIVIDGPALKIINRAEIPTFVFNGKKLDQLENIINNKKFNGTIIKI